MRLLRSDPNGNITIESCDDHDPPTYTILSHTWIAGQEITYHEFVAGTGKDKSGYAKIKFCGERTVADGYEYFWVDTCCIDKTSSQELSTAINSMFHWYEQSAKCYVYLPDVSFSRDDTADDTSEHTWKGEFLCSRWFTRGWTLQELLAPSNVEFYSRQGSMLGDRTSLETFIHEATGIPSQALQGHSLTDFSVEERFAWAQSRNTKEPEDKAYCLLGLFGIHMSLLYSEGEEKATARLKRKVERQQNLQISSVSDHVVPAVHTPRASSTQAPLKLEDFLTWLSYPEMRSRRGLIDNVPDNTCWWLLHHSNYYEWMRQNGSNPILMVRGKPGAGKSTAMKKAYELARGSTRPGEAVVGYFFNSRGAPIEANLEGFFRSILYQLMKNHGSTNDGLFQKWQQRHISTHSGWTWTQNELEALLRENILSSARDITIFVDALDECESTGTAHDLMDLVTRMCHHRGSDLPRLKVCVSSRHYPNIGLNEPLQIVVEDSNKSDISRYIENTLQTFPTIGSGFNISEEIASRAEGMFLWASLVLRKIREAIRDGEPVQKQRSIIRGTPKRLEELFKELIDGIPAEEREQSNLLICCVLLAKRPLSLPELAEALAFQEEHTSYLSYESSDGFVEPDQMTKLLAKYTRGLIEAVETNEPRSYGQAMRRSTVRVQFIHESVRQFVYSHRAVIQTGLDARWSKPGYGDYVLARSCFNYIRVVCVETDLTGEITDQLEQWRSNFIDTDNLTDWWEAIGRGSRERAWSKPAVWAPFRGPIVKLYDEHARKRPFLDYAVQNAFRHAKAGYLEGVPPPYLLSSNDIASWWKSFASMFAIYEDHVEIDSWYEKPSRQHWTVCSMSQLAFACAFELDSWVNHLLGRTMPIPSELDLSRALCVTAAFGNEATISSLIGAGARVDYEERCYGSPLYLSLRRNRTGIARTLIRHGAAVRQGRRRWNPLVAAVCFCSLDTVLSLLEDGVQIAEIPYHQLPPREPYSQQPQHVLEATLKRGVEFLRAVLPYAEHRRTPVDYYKAAYLIANDDHKAILAPVISRHCPGQSMIAITIQDLRGHKRDYQVWPDTRNDDLYRRVCNEGMFAAAECMMIHCTKRLPNQMTLRECGVLNGTTINLWRRVHWGGVRGTYGG